MICDDVIYLVSETPAAHGVFETRQETQKMCYCRVDSVTRSEFYQAKENGIQPLFMFVLSEYADYNGEKIVIYKDTRYRVIRSYVKNHAVELTVGEAAADAVAVLPTTGNTQTNEEPTNEEPVEEVETDDNG